MPRAFEMSWDAAQARWTKMYKGKRYTVACTVLGAPPTKEASYQAANEWWTKKRAEVDGQPTGNSPRVERFIQAAEDYLGRPLQSQEEFFATMQRVLSMPEPPAGFCETMIGPERVEQLRAGLDALIDGPAAPAGRAVKDHAGAWHKAQAARVQAGLMSAARAANNRTCLEPFRAYLGETADVGTLDAGKLQGFYTYCLSKISEHRQGKGGWSTAYARDVFSVAKSFVKWLAEQDIIPLPKNIGSKMFKFGNGSKTIKTWTVDEYRAAVAAAPGKLKLALLLMVNCGMTQQDISDLRDGEVDWQEGRVTRKRSKTAEHENVPTVCYKLWDVTFDLLKKYRSGQDRVLLTESGQPYVRTVLKEGKLSKADGFASNFVHLKRKLRRTLPSFNRSLKQLRKLGSTLIGGHKDYGRFAQFYLGHSPRTVADKNYVAPSQELFDKVIGWLAQQCGC